MATETPLSAEVADQDQRFIRRSVEAAIQIGLLFILATYTIQIVAPFITPVLWGVIISVALYPAYLGLTVLLGGRERLAAALVTIAMPAHGACLKVAAPAGYEHDRFVTVVVGQSETDNVRCRYRAYVSVFDGADDDDGDGEADYLRIPHFVSYG